MPKKVTKEQVDRIVFLRDSKGLIWDKIAKEIGFSPKTCKVHYTKHKESEGTRSEGKIHAEAFKIFSEGGSVFDVVQRLQITIEEAEQLNRKYIEHSKLQSESTVNNVSSVFTEYEVMRKRGELKQECEGKLFFIKELLGDIPKEKKGLSEQRIRFINQRISDANSISELNDLEKILKKEEKELWALDAEQSRIIKRKQQRIRAEKIALIVYCRMQRGMSREEAEKSWRKSLPVYNSFEQLYNIEKDIGKKKGYLK